MDIKKLIADGLPKKFCVKTSHDTEVHKWFNKKMGRKVHIGGTSLYLHCPEISPRLCSSMDKHTDYTEIPEEVFLKYIQNNNNTSNLGKFVRIIDSEFGYTTHPDARELGCTNYHYWKDLQGVKKKNVYEIVKEIVMDYGPPAYILKDKDGVEYIISKDGCSEPFDKPCGYQLKKTCKHYTRAVVKIMGEPFTDSSKHIVTDQTCIDALKEANVLDFWFEPIYILAPEVYISGYRVNFLDSGIEVGCEELTYQETLDFIWRLEKVGYMEYLDNDEVNKLKRIEMYCNEQIKNEILTNESD